MLPVTEGSFKSHEVAGFHQQITQFSESQQHDGSFAQPTDDEICVKHTLGE